VRPQDDLFRFANGGWLARTSVPAERVAYGVFQELAERTEHDLRAIIEGIVARGPHRRGTVEQQIADLYLSMADVERVDAAGAEPLRAELGRIAAVQTKSGLAAEIGRLSALGFGGPFGATLATNARDADRLVVQIEQGGTLLPNRDYYLKPEPAFAGIRDAYREYLTTIFELSGRPAAADEAALVLALETEIARLLWSEAKSREGSQSARPFTLGELEKTMPGFDWRAWAKPQGIDRADAIDLGQPSFFAQFATLIERTPLDTSKAWLSARYITAAAPYVSQPFELARFELFGRKLTGQPEPRARWRRSVGIVHQYLGDALGRLYVREHFPPKSRAKVRTLVSHLIAAFNDAIRHAGWMSGAARGAALDKLANLTTKIGYPDEWANYSGLEIRADDLLGNAQRALAYQHTLRLSRVRDPAARQRWFITPLAINAYYSPALNEIVLPAAILQPPLFNPDADPAVNYGAIGGIIGHELTHAFDAQGRTYDASGEVRNWWQARDERAFVDRLQQMASQFSAYRPLPDLALDGALTAAENLADLAGLSIALAAYRRSLDGKPAPVLDGFTGEQRVFLGWAQAWRGVLRENYLRQWLLITPHAPPEYRANGPLGNLDAFIDAFGVKPGDRLYRAPERRVRVW
jgi:putative endopeptidase